MAVFVKETKKPVKKALEKAPAKAKSARSAQSSETSAAAEVSQEALAKAEEAESKLPETASETGDIAKESAALHKTNRKSIVLTKAPPKKFDEVDSSKSVAFAMSIAKEMKQRTREESNKNSAGNEIRLTRRPTTRERGQTTERFPDADLQDFRKRLLDSREKVRGALDALKSTGFNEADDREADGGDGTNQTLRLQALGQMGTQNRTIHQIEEALHRIDDGSYGVCTVCGQLIRKPRLLNQPFVLTCMECQSAMEKDQNR